MEDLAIEKPRIPKLIGLNYRPWSIQIQRLLIAQALWEVVEQEPRPYRALRTLKSLLRGAQAQR
jgi:hypothetical protein